MSALYKHTKEYVKEYLFSKEASEQEKWYRYEHTLRVSAIGKIIAEKEQLDEEVIVLGCLLHDIGKFDTKEDREHGRVSAHIAKQYLQTLGIEEQQVERIYHGIAIHVDGVSDVEYPNFAEAETISDCDNIDRFDIYRAIETLEWKQFTSMNCTQGIALLKELLCNIEKYYRMQLSTTTATTLFHEALQRQQHFYTDLLNQYKKTISSYE